MKKTKSTDNRKLMDRLTPEPALGRLLGMVATTYEMQPEFFETDFLPTLLGLGAWDDRNWTSRIALERYLAELEAASVLVDARPYRGRPRSLRVEVQPVYLPAGRKLHAKVLVNVYEEAIRLVFGSANLTEPGYRRNREVAAALTATAKRQFESQLVRDALRSMRSLLGRWISPSAEQLLDSADGHLSDWAGEKREQDVWFVWGGGTVPLWRQVIDLWPAHDRVERLTIVSPFWSDEGRDGPITKLIADLRSRDQIGGNLELRLLTEAAPDKQGTYRPKLPESFASFDARSIGVTASAVAVDPRVPPEEVGMVEGFTGTRCLHAKVVLMEGLKNSLTFFGSANFTRRGWGFLLNPEQANIEAGLVVRRNGTARSHLQSLIPATTGDPVELAGAAQGRLTPPEPSPHKLDWPGFLSEVLLVPSQANPDRLDLVVLMEPQDIAGSWRIEHLPTTDEPTAAALVMHDPGNPVAHRISLSLTESQLERILREQEVHVKWWQCEEGRSFPVNVVAVARTDLPISPSSGHPEEQHLIAYYQGRITWEDLFPPPNEGLSPNEPGFGFEQDESSGVDTSRIQSYIVREFVEALKGITDDLKASAQSTKACMRLAILGSVSPVALARRVLEAADTSERTPVAAGFQLVEILGCLDRARSFPASPRFASDWTALVDEAAQKIVGMLESLRRRFPGAFSGDFQTYEKTIRQHQKSKAGVS